MDWLTRYRAGEERATWRALRDAGSSIRDDPVRLGDALAVADETMRRVRRNVERLFDALVADGYAFDHPGVAFVPPARDVDERLAEVERVVGPLPLGFRAWLRHVGRVNFTGAHPEWRYEYADALVVEAPPEWILADHADHVEMRWFELERTHRFPLSVAPDYLHKADVSGGPPYAIWLPDPGADPLWDCDDLHRTTFTEYLRSALLRWGGFPGWARRAPEWAAPREPWPARLAQIARELEPF